MPETTPQFPAPFDSTEFQESLPDRCGGDAVEMRGGDSHGGIAQVMLSRHGKLEV